MKFDYPRVYPSVFAKNTFVAPSPDDFLMAMYALKVRKAFRDCPVCGYSISDGGDHAYGCDLHDAEIFLDCLEVL